MINSPNQNNDPTVNLPIPQQSYPDPTVNVDTGQSPKYYDDNTAQARAVKIHFGLGAMTGKDYTDTYKDVASGLEPEVRNEASAQLNNNQALIKQQMITQAAARKGSPLSMDEVNNILNYKFDEATPQSVVEQAYSQKYMNHFQQTANEMGSESVGQSAVREIPQQYNDINRTGVELMTKNQMIGSSLEDLQSSINHQSWTGYGWDMAKTWIPFYNEYKLRANVPGTGFLTGGLLGGNLQAQAQKLLSEPLEQFKQDYPRIMKQLTDSNPQVALQFAAAMHGMSHSDVFMNNAFTLIDLASVPGVGALSKALATKIGITNAARTATRQMVESTAFTSEYPTTGVIPNSRALVVTHNIPTTAIATEAAGDIGTAAVKRATNNVLEDIKGRSNPIMRALEVLTSNWRMDKDALGVNPGNLSREQLLRIENSYDASLSNIKEKVLTTSRVLRIPLQQASESVMTAIKDGLKTRYPGMANRILDVGDALYEPVSNTWHMPVDISRPDGELYRSEQAAKISARMSGFLDPEIVQKGNGYHIRLWKPLDETSSVLRDFMISTEDAKSKGGWINAAIGWLRTPEDTMGRQELRARKAATYSQSIFRKLADEEAAHIKQLAKASRLKRSQWRQWKRAVAAGRDINDPVTGLPGYTFRNPGELDYFYMRNFQRMPSQVETEAYFAKSRFDLLDWAWRNISVYNHKTRLGAETHRLSLPAREGKPTYSEFFDGIAMNHIPGGDDAILVADDTVGRTKVYDNWSKVGAQRQQELNEGIKQGKLKLIRIYAPEYRPLQGFGNVGRERVRYIIANNIETKPLDWNQVPRRGGGHFDYDYDFYIKQANMSNQGRGDTLRRWYEGDTTLMAIKNRAMGQNIVKHLNNVRDLIRTEKIEDAKAYVRQHLPMEWDEINGWFNPKKDPKGHMNPARLSLDEPFHVVPKDLYIKDLDNSYVRYDKDGTRQGSDNAAYQVRYTGERDSTHLYTINDHGTRGNPLYSWEPAQFVDPISTMNNAMNRIIHSTFMDDYKVYAVEHWLREAEDHLVADKSEIRSSPFFHFNNIKDNSFLRGTPLDVKNNLMSNWWKIKQFTGHPSAFNMYTQRLQQALADSMYNRLGPKFTVVPEYALGWIKEPINAARQMAFHFKLGLFSVPQFMVQNQTWTNIYAISPRSALAGTMGALFHQWTKINPGVLEHLDESAAKFNNKGFGIFHTWKPGELKEAFLEGQRTGFFNVEGEYALRDNMMSHKFIANDFDNFLDLGQVFFREGVKNVRYGAWYTAFKEFRHEHPTGRITEFDRQKILDKADMYHANMSRASSSLFNHGIFSVPAQFLTYQIRLAEMFMSSRLTNMDRARMILTYAGLYGIPSIFGLSGFPLGDYFRRAAQNNGYVVGDKWYSSLFMEGIPSWIMGMSTGQWLNVGERYGAHGFDQLREALRSDTPWWNIIGGASWNVVSNTWSNLDGATGAFWSMINDGPYFPLKVDDVIQAASEITMVNQAYKFWVAATTGDWISKNGALIQSDVPLWSAGLMALTGMQPQRETDIFAKETSIKEREGMWKAAASSYEREMHKGFRAAKDGNPDQARDYFTRAKAYIINYPVDKRAALIAETNRGWESVIDRIDWTYYTKGIDPNQFQTMQKAYQREKELQNEGVR